MVQDVPCCQVVILAECLAVSNTFLSSANNKLLQQLLTSSKPHAMEWKVKDRGTGPFFIV